MRLFRPRSAHGSEPALYVAEEDDHLPAEWWRGIEIVLAPGTPPERLWFTGGEQDWGDWVTRDFGVGMAPGILRARAAAAEGVREWAEADEGFGRRLGSGDAAIRSLREGRRQAEARVGARHVRGLDRLRRRLTEHPEAGHAATVTAFVGAGFHVPPGTCLVACLYEEWHAAFPGRDRDAFADMTPHLGHHLAEWLAAARAFPALQSPVTEPE